MRDRGRKARRSAGATACARCRFSPPSVSDAFRRAEMRGIALAVLVAALLAVSFPWGSVVAGGPDSYCYVHQAERWAALLVGEPLQVPEPLALGAPWAEADETFTP